MRGSAEIARAISMASLGSLVSIITPIPSLSQTVLFNPLNNTAGGSAVTSSNLKSLSFQTGTLPTKLNNLTIGINPNIGVLVPLPANTTVKVTISIWSTNSAGVPVAPLKTLVNSQTISISAKSQSYTFNLPSDVAPLLNAKTKYALVLSSDATGLKWANNTDGLTAIGQNGYAYVSQLISTDSGDTWTSVGAVEKNTIVAQIFEVPYNAIMPQSYAAFMSVGLETLKRQRELLLSEAGSCEQNGWMIKAQTSKEQRSDKGSKKKKPPLCFNALATTSTSYINGDSNLFSYQSGITSGFYILEYSPSPAVKIGLAYGNGNSYLNSMPETNASIVANVNSGSIYADYQASSRLRVSGLLGYANFAAQSSRNVDYLDNGVSITGSPNANGYTASVEAKYRISSENNAKSFLYLEPRLGFAWGAYSQAAFVESGVDYLNLSVDSHTANSVIATAGTTLSTRPIPFRKGSELAFRPKLTIAYQADMLGNAADQMTLNQAFSSAPSAGTFAVQGQNRGVNNLFVEGGLDFFLNSKTALYASTVVESFSTGSQFTYQGGIRVAF